MTKQILFGKTADRAAILSRAGALLDDRPWIEACVLHMESEDLSAGTQAINTRAGGVEVVMEVWSQGDREILPQDAPFSCSAAYRVEEIVEKGGGVGFRPGPCPA